MCTHGEKVPRMAPKTPSETLEKLFELVRANPCLYDCTLPDHKDAVKISNIWQSIAKKLDIPDMTGMYRPITDVARQCWNMRMHTLLLVCLLRRQRVILRTASRTASRMHHARMQERNPRCTRKIRNN